MSDQNLKLNSRISWIEYDVLRIVRGLASKGGNSFCLRTLAGSLIWKLREIDFFGQISINYFQLRTKVKVQKRIISLTTANLQCPLFLLHIVSSRFVQQLINLKHESFSFKSLKSIARWMFSQKRHAQKKKSTNSVGFMYSLRHCRTFKRAKSTKKHLFRLF